MSDRRWQPRMGLGILLLANQLFSQHHVIPTVTLLAVVGQTLLYMGIINPPWGRTEVCLSCESILYFHDYRRLFLSAIEHSSDFHLYHNMASLILKGQSLERRYGTLKFLILLLVFTVASSLTYVGLAFCAAKYFESSSYMKTCAIGFSGVLFALKVVTTYHSGSSYQSIQGFSIPAKYAVWAELVLIHILVPNASFIGHLAGILVGLAYVYGPLWYLVDGVCRMLNPDLPVLGGRGYNPTGRQSYTYTRTTLRESQQARGEGQSNYGWNYHQD
ncbi:hypothetical protein Pcinc_007033 [Petrolisthes cinctipes]|uniref:Peptidase S54 rhomboid domain-containing protein n=1 Tax=Petrolisthes cinctipes TaxID=88211 RepID=A0AAE1GBS7_PETCI|nr:hypothetical protein Pcinc_007033 [Petrolisthes cinctipes]